MVPQIQTGDIETEVFKIGDSFFTLLPQPFLVIDEINVPLSLCEPVAPPEPLHEAGNGSDIGHHEAACQIDADLPCAGRNEKVRLSGLLLNGECVEDRGADKLVTLFTPHRAWLRDDFLVILPQRLSGP